MTGDRARISVAVSIAPARAFEMFTAEIDQWWRRGPKFRHSASPSSLLCIERKVGGRVLESFEADGAQHAPIESGTLVTVTHTGLSSLPPDHPARHGLQGAEFCRMIGLWWGDQMSSLRLACAAQLTGRE